jgi:regulator of replication initiation timing
MNGTVIFSAGWFSGAFHGQFMLPCYLGVVARAKSHADSRWKGGEEKMWRNKRPILMVALAVALLAGTVGGVALAQDEEGAPSQVEDRCGALLEKAGAMHDRVAEIYEENTGVALDLEQLENAFAQAREEMRAEALQNRLGDLVEQGILTQEEADEYRTWLELKPDVSLGGPCERGFGGRGFGGGMLGMMR